MRKLQLCCLLCGLLVLLVSCSREEAPTAPNVAGTNYQDLEVDAELIAGEIVMASGWEFDSEVDLPDKLALLEDKTGMCRIIGFEREELTGGIAHYSWLVTVGNTEYEVIRLHRVVKERRPYRPIRARENIFLLHGDAVAFAPEFLYGAVLPNVPDELGVAVYLAAAGVDVWGMDQPWKLIGSDVTDFSYMADWGLDYSADRLTNGLQVARLVRLFTGNGFAKLNLLGYSSGVGTGYVLLSREANLPSWRRNVAGFVAAEQGFVSAEVPNPSACGLADFYRSEFDNGVFEDQYFGIYFIELGNLAAADPDGPSPYFEGFTNLQAALGWGVYPEEGVTYHLVAGVFDDDGLPSGLQYTPVPGYLDFLQNASPYDPTRFVYEVAEISCGLVDTPFDDNLAAIQVPVLGIGAAGGDGEGVFYTLTQLGSTDVTTVLVQLHPDGEEAQDFGHVDIWTAENAPELVWQPLLDWIENHTHNWESGSSHAVSSSK